MYVADSGIHGLFLTEIAGKEKIFDVRMLGSIFLNERTRIVS